MNNIDRYYKILRCLDKTIPKEQRPPIVEALIAEHGAYLQGTLQRIYAADISDKQKVATIQNVIEQPLDRMADYFLGIEDERKHFRRKDFDGQTRKRKDGGTHKREFNTVWQCQLQHTDSDGRTYNEMDNVGCTDTYPCDNIIECDLSGNAARVADNIIRGKTIEQTAAATGLTFSQVRTQRDKIRNELSAYFNMKKIPYAEKKYFKKFAEKSQKLQSMCTI